MFIMFLLKLWPLRPLWNMVSFLKQLYLLYGSSLSKDIIILLLLAKSCHGYCTYELALTRIRTQRNKVIICWRDKVGMRMAVWVTPPAPVVRLTYFIALCGHINSLAGPSTLMQCWLVLRECVRKTAIQASCLPMQMHSVITQLLCIDNINGSQLLTLQLPRKSLFNFLSNIVLLTKFNRYKKVTFSDLSLPV